MRKAPSSDMMGGGLLTRLTSAMKSSASSSNVKQNITLSTSMGNSNSSDFFIRMALDMLQTSKEGRRNEPLKAAIRLATGALDSTDGEQSPVAIFKPFQIACESGSAEMATIAIDCMGKLFTYDYWGRASEEYDISGKDGLVVGAMGLKNQPHAASLVDEQQEDDSDNDGTKGMISFVIGTICNGFAGESTDEKVQLQIIKALQAALTTSTPAYTLHGAILLKAIRTTYNIFLLSKSQDVQIVAQSTVTQMIQNVFGRVPRPAESSPPSAAISRSGLPPSPSRDSIMRSKTISSKPASPRTSSFTNAKNATESKIILDGKRIPFHEESPSNEQFGPIDIIVNDSEASNSRKPADQVSGDLSGKESCGSTDSNILALTPAGNQALKDAFKLLRTLCILSMKPIPSPEGTMDLRSQPVRSKLLALHLINTVLGSHAYVFSTISSTLLFTKEDTQEESQITFIEAAKEFLILSLSRNATSVILPVFEVSMEIFGKLMLHSRTLLKREISVFFTEIIIPILDSKKNIPWYQRYSLLKCLQKIFGENNAEGGRMLVEIYLNYDCDLEATAKENIWERMFFALEKIASQPIDNSMPATFTPLVASSYVNVIPGSAPALTTSNLVALSRDQVRDMYSTTGDSREMKRRCLEFISRGILGPLVQWCQSRVEKPQPTPDISRDDFDKRRPYDIEEERSGGSLVAGSGGLHLFKETDEGSTLIKSNSFRTEDDPTAFENLKHRKQVMIEGIKRFNSKPKKGIQFLLDSNCIAARTPWDIARFLLTAEGLNKSMIGEFLGEGDEENIAIMHAFVDEMEFTNHGFVDALRMFLQSFRLPGEAQKIDRFMLKFAERYLKGNPKKFSSADTAYVLAYSVIMLNTDQHNAQVKRRMTKADFLKNNRGIDEGKDLPALLLEQIFDEIQSNEIVMKDEIPDKSKDGSKIDKANGLGLPGDVDILLFGKLKKRDGPPEISKTTENMALKTEAIFASMMRSKTTAHSPRNKNDKDSTGTNHLSKSRPVSVFYSASHYEHVKPMFQLIWMSVLTSISAPLKDTDDIDTISVSLDGFRYAVHIACLFEMELAVKAFVSTLGKFTILNNIQEMRAKNFEAIRTLLDIAYLQGNYLLDSWGVVVLCISQLEKLQIVGGVALEEAQRTRGLSERTGSRRESSSRVPGKGGVLEDVAAEASSQTMALSVDRIFTSSAKLSGSAILDFVRALCGTSWDEIKSSSDKEHPRMYCLQRLVEISYYNMKRIRVEWSNIWAILGQHFNQVGSYPNTNVAFFAVDKLRQLAMKFLELEELPNFKFQKDFLRPFEVILRSNVDIKVKDMCLACIQQMVQAKSKSLKSGWKMLFGALLRPSRETNEPLVTQSYEIIKGIFKTSFENILVNSAYPEFVACVVEFCKNAKFGKISLHAVELLRQSICRVAEILEKQEWSGRVKGGVIASTPLHFEECLSPDRVVVNPHTGSIRQTSAEDDTSVKYWMPVLFGLQDVIMTSELEVRTRGLQYLFEILRAHGDTFSCEFWALLSKGVLFPIFDDLKHSGSTSLANSKFINKEEMQIWLSTTLIQALRQLVDLFSLHFDSVQFILSGMLDILRTCLTHENEALSRIGSTCLNQLIEHNATRLNSGQWNNIVDLFESLCQETTPFFLFINIESAVGSDGISLSDGTIPADLDPDLEFLKTSFGPPPDKADFQRLLGKCVLHLSIIQTLNDTMMTGPNDAVYKSLSPDHLFRLIDCFEKSFRFARAFNQYTSLRTALFRLGYMKQMPNLLKQETLSVSAYLRYMAKISLDKSPEKSTIREQSEKRLIPLCIQVLAQYNSYDNESKRRSLNSWKPVITMILNTMVDLDDDQFRRYIKEFYIHMVNLLLHEMGPELRLVLHSLMVRTGVTFSITSDQVVSESSPKPMITATTTTLSGFEKDDISSESGTYNLGTVETEKSSKVATE
ncbi:hypothetical protein BASA50_003422 [Batrachochytrium salamandrivorans]|uniref:SEC7 domain-containing protein n=1 Tax=Batrachochytrium salamandrivorans TaxID=1357716 RepID=A0ABQ8FLR4_9FUNG|nr:hypothetical protein BASA50_003422 [Batrachochytrium salamandrivorans]